MYMSFSGCPEAVKLMEGTGSSENPLSGKNTDERIIMCLEQIYPEHTFNKVTSFDESIGYGIYSDEKGVEISDISLAIHEILNCVDVPEVNWPEEQGLSTGVVNYYTVPNRGVLLCRCEAGQNAANEVFTFEDVNLTKQEIEQRLETCYGRIQN